MDKIKIEQTFWEIGDYNYPFVLKFREAEHFYNEMLTCSNEGDTDKFEFNLSAFITAARSVSMVMASQYQKYDWCKQWAEQVDKEIKADEAFTFLNDKRIETLKIKPVDVSCDESFVFNPPLTNFNAIKTEKNGKTILSHTISMVNINGSLIVEDINGVKNPEAVVKLVEYYFSDNNYHVLGFGRHIMNQLAKFTRELCVIVSDNEVA